MKTCFKCKVEKPRSEFYKHPMMGDGLLGKCKDCTKVDNVTNRARNLDYYQAYDRSRSSDPKRIAGRKNYHARYKIDHNDQWKANCKVRVALNSRRITKQPCADCSNPKAEAHHHDYTKPLDVIWLCAKCHHAKHRKYDYAALLSA